MSVDIGDVEMIVNTKIQQLIAAVEKALPYEGGRIAEEFKKQQYYKAMETAKVERSAFDPIVDPNADVKNILTREDVAFDYSYDHDDKRFNFNHDTYVPDTEEFEAALVKNPHLFIGDDYVDLKDFYLQTTEECSEEGIQKFCEEMDEEIKKTEWTKRIFQEVEKIDSGVKAWKEQYDLAMSKIVK